MAVDVRSLFRIVGEAGSPALRRVEQAVEWLLSPAAEGLGEKLLRLAHELHGEPLLIEASEHGQNAYFLDHKIRINPRHVDMAHIRNADGVLQPTSLEGAIAHELTHAGQKDFIEAALKRAAVEAEFQGKYMSRFSPEEITAHNELLAQAMAAPDQQAGRALIEQYVNKVSVPMGKALNAQVAQHPEFIDYVERMEIPAIENENKVLKIKGLPTRSDYVTSYHFSPEDYREMMIGEMMEAMSINQKPLVAAGTAQRVDGRPWTAAIEPRTGRALGG